MPKTDPRWQAVAEVLVHYSTDVQPGERVMIAMGEIESFPLAHAVYESCIKAGAFPQVQLLSEKLRHSRAATRYGSNSTVGCRKSRRRACLGLMSTSDCAALII